MGKEGRLIILVGIDGSGKSTLVRGLEQNGYKATHWRKLREKCPELDFTSPAESVQKLDGEERLSFILSYIQSEWRYLIQPLRKRGVDVISDGFFARFYAKEKIYQRMNLDHLRRHCPLDGNAIFIMVDTPPAVALGRKGLDQLSPYEFFRGPEDFVEFQQRQRDELMNFIKGYKYYLLDGNKSKDMLLSETLAILKDIHSV